MQDASLSEWRTTRQENDHEAIDKSKSVSQLLGGSDSCLAISRSFLEIPPWSHQQAPAISTYLSAVVEHWQAARRAGNILDGQHLEF
eukprot:745616-Amphidinium_carterae.1